MDRISVFGGYGFVGSRFLQDNTNAIRVPRDAIESPTPHILNFISTTTNYNVYENPFLDIETNLVHFMKIVVENHKKWGEQLIVSQISTWFVYDGKRIPASEDNCSEQYGFYSITSKCREQLLKSYAELKGFKYRILRLGNVVGIGDKKISRKKNALQHIIRELAQGRNVDYLYKGGAIRDFIDVRDCVRAIRLVLEKGNLNETYNIANGLGLNVNDLVEVAHRETGFKSKVMMIDVPEFHRQVQTPKMVLDVRKLKSLGYVQQYDIKQSVRELVHHYRHEPTENT